MGTEAHNNNTIRKSVACVTSSFGVVKGQLKTHRFTISFSQTGEARETMGIAAHYTSPPFTVGGFIWNIRFFPATGPGGDDISLYLYKHRPSDMDVYTKLAFHILGRSGDPGISVQKICTFKHGETDCGNGWYCLTTRAKLRECVKDDNIVIDCCLTVYEMDADDAIGSRPTIVPRSGIHNPLAALVERKEMTDVVFLVDGENIPAHKLVLAASSPVFKAALYGSMLESGLECIPIPDMKASVFKAMLHYMYTGALPENVTLHLAQSGNCLDELSVSALHLLEAADKYGLDSLKLICEEKLCRNLNVETVATTLALAHQHGCTLLKATCLEYMADPINYVEVTMTQGFIHLMQSCPEVMSELYRMVKRALGSTSSQ